MRKEPLELRFWSKVVKQKNGCWVWTGGKNEKGYGLIRLDNYSHRSVHVLSYEWAYGTVLPGMEIDHTCRNRACVNPRHLEVVTHAENIRRLWERTPHVPRTHCSKGHALEGENVAVSATRTRCRTCARRKTAESRARRALEQRPLPPRPTHCFHGHVMDDTNATSADGSWRCKRCLREATARYRAKKE